MITTNRCFLNLLQESDYEEVKQLYTNDQVRLYLGGTTDSEELLRNKISEVLDKSREDGSRYWSIRLLENNELIGLTSLDKYHDGENIEVSYQFLPKFWGIGLAVEVISRIVLFAFEDLGLKKLVAETQTANIRSCKLLEKIGMIMEKKIIRFDAEQAVYSIQRS